MKFYSNQLSKIIANISNGSIKSVLFHGPDHGLIEYSINKLSKTLKLQRRNNSFNDIEAGDINSMLNNASFFAEKEVISVKNAPSNPNASLKELFSKQHHNILVLGAGELTTSSPLRKLYESEKDLASVGCYNDNEASVEQIIRAFITKYSKKISPEALNFLKNNLHGDRFIIINELKKLFCYAFSKDLIALEDVMNVISTPSIGEADKLCLFFINNNKKGFFSELDILLGNNISPIWIIRALARYYINATIALKQITKGNNVESAISSLPNPIFFKYKADFSKAVSKMNYNQAVQSLNILYEAEKTVKSGTTSDKDICLKMFFDCNGSVDQL